MNELFFNKPFKTKVLKKWVSSQTSKLIDEEGITYIEKIENQVNNNGQICIVPYGSDELEIYEKILTPLKVDHVNVIASERKPGESKFVLEYVPGLTCSEKPKPIHLYMAAIKIGQVYKQSIKNIEYIDKNIFHKYNLTKEKMLDHIYAISKSFDTSGFIEFINNIYINYKNYPVFLNHYDIHLKNMIYLKNNIYIIDWATAQITPFYSDLYILLRQASEVKASKLKILENFKNSSGLSQITEEEILVGAMCWCIPAIHWLLDLQGTDDVPFFEWAEDEYMSLLEAFKQYKVIAD